MTRPGASLALVGGYVLAARLSTAETGLDAAFAAYEEWMRPLVDDVQTLSRWIVPFAYPADPGSVWRCAGCSTKVLTSRPFAPVVAKFAGIPRRARPQTTAAASTLSTRTT